MTGPQLLELEVDLDEDELGHIALKDVGFARGEVRLESLTREDRAWVLEHAKRLAAAFGVAGGRLVLKLDGTRGGFAADPGRPWSALAAAEQERAREAADEIVKATYSLVVI